MNLRFVQFAFSSILGVLVSGCSALDALNVQKPTATFRSARLENVTADGLTANFDIAVDNPNSFSVPLTTAQYKLALGGVQVVDDQAKPDAAIPAQGSLPVTVPVRLNFQHLLSAEQAIAQSGGNIPYDFDGALHFSPGKLPLAQDIKVPIHFKGTLPLRDALTAVARDPSVLANPDARKVIELVLGKGMLGGLLNRLERQGNP
ncbi:MAG TPA: LEA type 2 family protein [Planctomycetaceae bacterium]|nr:LEA type 2 family protein [Planctomycetaceae bacterium]